LRDGCAGGVGGARAPDGLLPFAVGLLLDDGEGGAFEAPVRAELFDVLKQGTREEIVCRAMVGWKDMEGKIVGKGY
jgi:hypothetical protein